MAHHMGILANDKRIFQCLSTDNRQQTKILDFFQKNIIFQELSTQLFVAVEQLCLGEGHIVTVAMKKVN